MKTFLEEFLPDEAAIHSAHLAAFGKHPGWDDHIDDLGIETTSLALAKRLLYFEGIGRQIDAGGWETLDPDARLEAFDHLLVWMRGRRAMVGRLHASRDGKGRSRYPLVLCAEIQTSPGGREIERVVSALDVTLAVCAASAEASEVEAAVELTRRHLRAPRPTQAEAEPPPVPLRLSGQAVLGPDDEGLRRVFYVIRAQMCAWAPGAMVNPVSPPSSVHLRVPRVGGDLSIELPAWIALITSQLRPGVPCLAYAARKEAWIDLVVGEPSSDDFFGLRAALQACPCVTAVPYEMDEAFRERADRLIADLNAGVTPRALLFNDTSFARSPWPRRWLHSTRAGWSCLGRVGRAAVAVGVSTLAVIALLWQLWPEETAESGESKEVTPPQLAQDNRTREATMPPLPETVRTAAAQEKDVPMVPDRGMQEITPELGNIRSAGDRPPEPTGGGVVSRAIGQEWLDRVLGWSISESGVVQADWERRRAGWLQGVDAAGLQADLPRALFLQDHLEGDFALLSELAKTDYFPLRMDGSSVFAIQFQELLYTKREAALRVLLPGVRVEANVRAIPTEWWLRPETAVVVAEFQRARRNLDTFRKRVEETVAQIASGRPWQEGGRESFQGWHRDEFAVAVAETATPLGQLIWRGRQLDELVQCPHAALLEKSIRGDAQVEALTAWKALTALPGAAASDWKALRAMADELEARWGAGQGRIQAECEMALRMRWHQAFTELRTLTQLPSLFAAQVQAGVAEGELTPRERLLKVFHDAHQRSWNDDDPVRGREERDRLVEHLRSLRTAAPTWTDQLVGELLSISFDEPIVEGGPAKTGAWKRDNRGTAERYFYVWRPDERTRYELVFRSVNVEGRAVCVAEQELPVGLALAWLSHTQKTEAFAEAERDLLAQYGDGSPRYGPRAYQFDQRSGRWTFRVALTWLSNEKTSERPPPEELTPINYISPKAARVLAASLNCRLPTVAEWRAALQTTARDGATLVNRRDQTWARTTLSNKVESSYDAFRSRYEKGAVPIPEGESAVPAVEADDGILWFAPVSKGEGDTFKHLIGNVAEYVEDSMGRVGVIGASALSPKEIEPEVFQKVFENEEESETDRFGYSDVGLRLAFSLEQVPAVRRVQTVLQAAATETSLEDLEPSF